jgi:hypothetical protein
MLAFRNKHLTHAGISTGQGADYHLMGDPDFEPLGSTKEHGALSRFFELLIPIPVSLKKGIERHPRLNWDGGIKVQGTKRFLRSI